MAITYDVAVPDRRLVPSPTATVCGPHWAPPRPDLVQAFDNLPPGVYLTLNGGASILSALQRKMKGVRFQTFADRAQAVQWMVANPPGVLMSNPTECYAAVTQLYGSTVNLFATYGSPMGKQTRMTSG